MGLPNIGPLELIIILAVLLLVVGPRRLPEMGQAVGRTIREFRKASSDITDTASIKADAMPATPVATVTPAVSAPAQPVPPTPAPVSAAAPESTAAADPGPAPESAVELASAAVTVPESVLDEADRDTIDDASRPA
jgi:TatA/E family protein of Tat protein translocase